MMRILSRSPLPALLFLLALLPARQSEAGPAENWRAAYRESVHYFQVGDRKKAEAFALDSLKQAESLGPFPRNVEVLSASLNMLASLTDQPGRYPESIRYRKRELELTEKFFGPDNMMLCVGLTNLAKTYDAMGKPDEAERVLERSAEIRARTDPRSLPSSLMPLGDHYEANGKLAQAEATFLRIQAVYEKRGGLNNPALRPVLERLSSISAKRGNAAQAKSIAARAAKLPD